MRLIAYSILLLVTLEESYCRTTSSVNKTSTIWGYDYSLNDTRGYKGKHGDKGDQLEPFSNTSSDPKKHYNSRSVNDQFTSPAAPYDSQSHSSTNDVVNGTSNGTTNSRSNVTVPHKVLFDSSAGGESTTDFRRVLSTKTHTVIVTETQTEDPFATDKTSYETPSSSHSIPVDDIIRSPNVPSNGQLYKTTLGATYGSQNTPMYAAPTGPLYYPQAPSYGQMYGPAGGSMYGITNGQMYGPPIGQRYGPPIGKMYGPPIGQMYEPPMGGTYRPYGPFYGLPTQSIYEYAPQNAQLPGPPNGQMHVPQNGQTNGYPTESLYRSNRNY